MRAQITLFMILGITFLSVFFFLYATVSFVQEQKLTGEQLRTASSALRDETVNFAASVCVRDSLAQALEELSRQGFYLYEEQLPTRIGKIDFGTWDVTYGITQNALIAPPAYPCGQDSVSNPPVYCKYRGERAQFGTFKLPPLESGIFSVKSQLERYIARYLKTCTNLTTTLAELGFSQNTVNLENPVVLVNIGSDTVAAEVKLPITIDTADGSLVHALNMQAEVSAPLRRMHRIVSDVLQKDREYNQFDPFHSKRENDFFGVVNQLAQYPGVMLEQYPLGTYDVFVFNDTENYISGKNFAVFIARENRPPALHFIEYDASETYEVLLIQGEKADINLNATDPDEDVVSFGKDDSLGSEPSNSVGMEVRGTTLLVDSLLTPGYYNPTVFTSDGFLEDWQTVRVLVDNPITLHARADNLYDDIDDSFASLEDPVLINFSQSSVSLDPDAVYNYSVYYLLTDEFGSILESFEHHSTDSCGLLPGLEHCFVELPIASISTFKHTADRAALNLRYRIDYGSRVQDSNVSLLVTVKQCLPHRNPGTAPSPFNLQPSSEFYPNNPVANPFQADHTCCLGEPSDPGTWHIAPATQVCYSNPSQERRCNRLLLEQEERTVLCDGVRGNICAGADNRTWKSTGVCGTRSVSGCGDVALECEATTPFALFTGRGWCHGVSGCGSFCGGFFDEIVDLDATGTVSAGDGCGCTAQTLGKPCDENFDGIFAGSCESFLGVITCSE